MQKLTYKQKISLTAGSAALLAPAIGQASLVHFDTSNAITVSYGGTTTAEWDVDGGGVNDFNLFTDISISTNYIYLDSNGRNGRGMVKAGNNPTSVNALSNGFVIGGTLAGGYNWGSGSQSFRMLLSSSSSVGADFIGAGIGSNFIGFRFDKDDNGSIYYGWAEVILAANTVTIKQWAYNDVADSGIAVGAGASSVPTPPALALLACGAAGLLTWRRKKQATETTS